MNSKRGLLTCIFLIIASTAFAQLPTLEKESKLLLIHLDAVSYDVLAQEIEAGNMPNVDRIFGRSGFLETAITYFPTKTSHIISNIRQSTPTSESQLVGWEIPQHNGVEDLHIYETFVMMALTKMRPARTNLIYGLPPFRNLNNLALRNTLDLFDVYPVIEYYWYSIDTYGHFSGKEAYLKRLHEFDHQIGRYIDQLDDDINVVIYADHGMVFGEGFEEDQVVIDELKDEVNVFSYPSVYLNNPGKKESVAKTFVENTPIDFAFFLADSSTAVGYFSESKLIFSHQDGLIRYSYEGEDPLRYYEGGYNGEYLSGDEWLLFSINYEYPALPILMYSFLMNENSGDVIVGFDSTKYFKTGYSSQGNHGGFTATEMRVPVLVYGPDVEYIGDFEALWTPELFNEISDFEFGQTPRRDHHYLSTSADLQKGSSRSTLAISPSYRFRAGMDVDMNSFNQVEPSQIWGKYDFFRSYITRLWIGGGIDFTKTDTIGMFMLRHEFRYRNFSLESSVTTSRNNYFMMGYDLFPFLRAELYNLTGVGIRIRL